jgi:hypothetical protein
MRTLVVLLAIGVSSCSREPGDAAERFTLYRNSPIERSLRVEWASFNAHESDPNYNRNNCQMAARLLNANLAAYRLQNNEGAPGEVGFWCEPGAYSEKGAVPSAFEAAFPTDVPQANRVPG